MEKLQINMFCSKPERFNFSLRSYIEISNCLQRDQLILCIHTDPCTVELWKRYLQKNRPAFNVQLIFHKTSGYLEKVYYAHRSSCKSSSKIIQIEPTKFHDIVQVRHSYLDTSKLRSFGFELQNSIEDIIKRLVDHYTHEKQD